MLTGRQAFGGTDISETLAAVLKTDLDLDSLPAVVPHGIRRVLGRCLQKDRARRARDIGDVRLDFDETLSLTPPAPTPIVRTSIVLPQTHRQTAIARRSLAVSPAGTHVVHVANGQLYLRALDQLGPRPSPSGSARQP